FSFYFEYYLICLILYPFPTRRSSDLCSAICSAAWRVTWWDWRTHSSFPAHFYSRHSYCFSSLNQKLEKEKFDGYTLVDYHCSFDHTWFCRTGILRPAVHTHVLDWLFGVSFLSGRGGTCMDVLGHRVHSDAARTVQSFHSNQLLRQTLRRHKTRRIRGNRRCHHRHVRIPAVRCHLRAVRLRIDCRAD